MIPALSQQCSGTLVWPLQFIKSNNLLSLLPPLSFTFLNPFLRLHLPGLPPPPHVSLPFVPVWIFHIAAAAGAWCGGLSAHCVYAVWVLRYVAARRVVCRDRRVAADASRPPACLSVCLCCYTWPALTPPCPHTHICTLMDKSNSQLQTVPNMVPSQCQFKGHQLLPLVSTAQEAFLLPLMLLTCLLTVDSDWKKMQPTGNFNYSWCKLFVMKLRQIYAIAFPAHVLRFSVEFIPTVFNFMATDRQTELWHLLSIKHALLNSGLLWNAEGGYEILQRTVV